MSDVFIGQWTRISNADLRVKDVWRGRLGVWWTYRERKQELANGIPTHTMLCLVLLRGIWLFHGLKQGGRFECGWRLGRSSWGYTLDQLSNSGSETTRIAMEASWRLYVAHTTRGSARHS
jgi:hypothetical protein